MLQLVNWLAILKNKDTMQDNQDNTFPIPTPDPQNTQAGGSITPPNNTPPPISEPPAVAPSPTEPLAQPFQQPQAQSQPQPIQPDWAAQATQDANALPAAPAGADTFSINTPSQPGELGGAAVPDTTVPPQPLAPPADTTPTDNFATPQVPPPAQEPAVFGATSAEPFAAASTEPTEPPASIPLENTLDLSGQNVPLEPAMPPVPDTQSGILQPGVDVNPSMPSDLPPIEGQAQDPNLANIPTDFGDSNNAIAANMASADSKKKFPKKIIIIAGAIIGAIVVISIVLVIINNSKPKPAVDLNQAQVDDSQSAPDNTTTVPATIPDGFKKVDRDCFSFGVFLPTTVDFAKTNCKITAKFGSASQYSISVAAVTDSVNGLQALVDQSKLGTITSQENIKLGGIEAIKVIQKVNGLDQQTVVVIPTNKNYQLDGKVINGFIINTSYNDDTAKKASDTLVSTWFWK